MSTTEALRKPEVESRDSGWIVRSSGANYYEQTSPDSAPSFFGRTISVRSADIDIEYSMNAPLMREVPSVEQKIDVLEASVLSVDGPQVNCEVTIPGRESIRINLHVSLFPERPLLGMPISIQMHNDGGIRKPQVTVRHIKTTEPTKESIELDRLIAGE